MTTATHEVEAAVEYPVRACTPWCKVGDGHGDEHPEDRRCWSEYESIVLTHRDHRPSLYNDGVWRRPQLSAYLTREHDVDEFHVVIHSEDTDRAAYLSLDQARALRGALDRLLALDVAQ